MTDEKGNTGHGNTGNRNTGHGNTGHRNTGDWNTGNRNTGDWNTGNRNTGNRNTGHGNAGHGNAGDWNAGDWNTGHGNTGNRNAGDWNAGGWNAGDWNAGYFNIDTPPTIRCFGVKVTRDEWRAAYIPGWLYASDPEKGDIKAQYRAAYEAASPEDQRAPAKLPGFDPDIFEQIIGVRIEKDAA